jgi:hypothetical protein
VKKLLALAVVGGILCIGCNQGTTSKTTRTPAGTSTERSAGTHTSSDTGSMPTTGGGMKEDTKSGKTTEKTTTKKD